MIKVHHIVQAEGPWDETLVLSFEQRQKSRLRIISSSGIEFGLQLPRGTVLQHGQRLQAEDGRIIKIEAALEPLSEVNELDAEGMARVCYHLGNRHVPVQIKAHSVCYLQDHVLDQMLRQMGFQPKHVQAAFVPEAGAFKHH